MEVVCAITCFHGRKEKVERVITCFQEQTLSSPRYHLLYNNSPQKMERVIIPDTILINNDKDLLTGEPYTNTGAIFRDALTYVPKDVTCITFMDSDDLFLPTHLEQGLRGLEYARVLGKLAYKPRLSIVHYGHSVSRMENNHEPSIFVDKDFVIEEGFYPVACSYHQKWLNKLIMDKTIHTPDHPSTFIYDWSHGHGDFKISGLADDPSNFGKHREEEKDFGDSILRPSPINHSLKYVDYQ